MKWKYLRLRVNFREYIVECLQQLLPGQGVECDDVEALVVWRLLKLRNDEFELITHVRSGQPLC